MKDRFFANGAKPIGGTLIDKLGEVECWSQVLTDPTLFSGQLFPLTRHRGKGMSLDFRSSKGHTRAKWRKGGHSKVTDSCHSRVIRNQQNLYPKFLLLP